MLFLFLSHYFLYFFLLLVAKGVYNGNLDIGTAVPVLHTVSELLCQMPAYTANCVRIADCATIALCRVSVNIADCLKSTLCQVSELLTVSGGGGGFFLACEDLGRTFDNSFLRFKWR